MNEKKIKGILKISLGLLAVSLCVFTYPIGYTIFFFDNITFGTAAFFQAGAYFLSILTASTLGLKALFSGIVAVSQEKEDFYQASEQTSELVPSDSDLIRFCPQDEASAIADKLASGNQASTKPGEKEMRSVTCTG